MSELSLGVCYKNWEKGQRFLGRGRSLSKGWETLRCTVCSGTEKHPECLDFGERRWMTVANCWECPPMASSISWYMVHSDHINGTLEGPGRHFKRMTKLRPEGWVESGQERWDERAREGVPGRGNSMCKGLIEGRGQGLGWHSPWLAGEQLSRWQEERLVM